MPAAPLLVAILIALSTVLGAVSLAVSPAPFSEDAAALIAVGLVIVALVAVAGTLLARGRWSRPTSGLVATAWVAIGAIQSSRWGLAVVVTGAAALAGVAGPWLSRWLRHRPASDGPPPAAVAALLVLLATPAALGLALADGVPTGGWVLAVWSPTAALAIARALPGSLLVGRILHPAAAAACGATLPLPGLAVAAASGIAVTAAMWRRDVAVAITPVVPIRGEAIRFPPELTPPEILHAAGLDESGRGRKP